VAWCGEEEGEEWQVPVERWHVGGDIDMNDDAKATLLDLYKQTKVVIKMRSIFLCFCTGLFQSRQQKWFRPTITPSRENHCGRER